VEFSLSFNPSVTVKHLTESLGVPHTEVDLILVNGEPAGFDYQVKDGDRISVYPVFEALNIASIGHLHPQPLRDPRFVLDTHLGRLAVYLRMLGFNTLYRNDYSDQLLAGISVNEGRILLTRDRGLLKRKEITRGYCVRSIEPMEQIREILDRFDLMGMFHPLNRCLCCNGLLIKVAKTEIISSLQPKTSQFFDDFTRCETCGQVYWKGSHYARMLKIIHDLESAGKSEIESNYETDVS
jgi:uncharacterized protein with PIN domain/sulfur carrier protein ThiS